MSQDKLFIPKAILIAIAIISLGTTLGVIFYSLSLNKSAPAAVAPTPAQTPNTIPAPAPDDVPAPTPIPDETADWNVYRSEEYGFEFKYPASWNLQDKSNEKFQIYSLYLDQSSILASPILQITKNPGGIGYEFLDFYSSESVKIGEITTQKRSFKPTESWFGKCDERQTQGGFHILFSKEKDEYEILTTYCQSTDVFNPDIFDQILSTFKFTEKDETADWNVYRNEKFEYEIKYPVEWRGGEESLVAQVASFTFEKRDAAQSGFWIYVYENPNNLSAKDWWINEYKKGSAKYSYKGTIQFSGINMEVYKEEDGLEFTYYIFSENSDIYLISSPIVEEKIHQILSTFKLTK